MSYRLKIAISVAVVLLLVIFAGTLLINRFKPLANRQLAIPPKLILTDVEPNFKIQTDATMADIKLRSNSGVLYKAQGQHMDAVKEFLQANPIYEGSDGKRLFPDGTAEDAKFQRTENDAQNPTYQKLMKDTSTEHYYYEQSIHDIPVYGSHLQVHLRNNNEIYDVDGKLLTDANIPAILVSNEQAETIAKDTAKNEADTETDFMIGKTKKYLFNQRLLGLTANDTNHLVLMVPVSGEDFGVNYFVDLSSGKVIFSTPQHYESKQRSQLAAPSCNVRNLSACKVIRSEGQPAIGDAEANKAYDYVGEIYDYYKSRFGRDSYDGAGGALRILPHYKPLVSTDIKCPNAFWLPRSGYPESAMVICDGMVAMDVITHEMTHGITEYTAGLRLFGQSGSLNEGISDIFGQALDSGNWSMGESTVLGAIRYFDDPTKLSYGKSGSPRKTFPDRLSASGYLCPQDVSQPGGCNKTNDYCGVHVNATVIDKTYYLMTAGGTFNGCTIRGLGAEKTEPIIYRAQTTYLSPTSNFLDMYRAINDACHDLYRGSKDCDEVAAAMQATELDQQASNDYLSPVCRGETLNTPTCANRNPSDDNKKPTSIPTKPPSKPEPTQANIPPPNNGLPDNQPVTGNCSGNQAEIPTLIGPTGKVKQGSVVFSWKTSRVQNGFYFRLLFNRDPKHQKDPEVIMDNWHENSISESELTKNGQRVPLPAGKHAWWVHSLCDGKVTAAKGADFEVVANTPGQGLVPLAQPSVTVKPTAAPAQGQGIIIFK